MKVLIEFELDDNLWSDYENVCDELLLEDLIDCSFCCGVISNRIVKREK